MSDDDDKSQHVDSNGLYGDVGWATASASDDPIADVKALADDVRNGAGMFRPTPSAMPHPPMGIQCRSVVRPVEAATPNGPVFFRRANDSRLWVHCLDGTTFALACEPLVRRFDDTDSIPLFRVVLDPASEQFERNFVSDYAYLECPHCSCDVNGSDVIHIGKTADYVSDPVFKIQSDDGHRHMTTHRVRCRECEKIVDIVDLISSCPVCYVPAIPVHPPTTDIHTAVCSDDCGWKGMVHPRIEALRRWLKESTALAAG